jgi:hypothetical protein
MTRGEAMIFSADLRSASGEGQPTAADGGRLLWLRDDDEPARAELPGRSGGSLLVRRLRRGRRMIMRTRNDGSVEWQANTALRQAFWNPRSRILRLSGPAPDSRGEVVARSCSAPADLAGTPHREIRAWMTRGITPMRPFWTRAL